MSSKNSKGKQMLDLPSTTTKGGGRMHTRSYARAVIEGVKKVEGTKVKVAAKLGQKKKEKKTNKKKPRHCT